MNAFLGGLVCGVLVFIGTAVVLGTQKASWLPGGALVSSITVGAYTNNVPLAILGGLAGHVVAVVAVKLLWRSNGVRRLKKPSDYS